MPTATNIRLNHAYKIGWNDAIEAAAIEADRWGDPAIRDDIRKLTKSDRSDT